MNPLRRKTPWEKSPWRIGVFITFTALVLLVLVVRLAQVQIVHGEEYRNAAQANQIRLIPVSAPRGTIFDRHGHVLVRNRPSFVVGLIPSEVKDIASEMKTLSQSIGVPRTNLWKRLLHHRGINYKDFDEVASYEPYGPVILASDLSVAHIARVAELQSDLPGVDLEAQPVRDYPMRSAGSHLFGYVGQITEDEYKRLHSQGYSPNDVIGKDGLEYQYDTYLRGKPGGQRIVVDAQGQVVPSIKLPPKPPVSGDALVLNIDWRLQAIAERALTDEIKTWGHGRTYGGAVAIEDPWSGAVLALVSYPNFNPNDFATGISDKQFSSYLNSPQEPLYNRAIAAATPTGSTFKMVTGSGAITAGVIGVKEVIYDSGGWNCGGAEFRDLASGGLGDTTFVPALAASSDGYFYQVSWRLGNPRLRYYALQYGLSKKSGIDLPGEFAGNWPTNASMLKNTGLPLEPSDVCSLGIGQGAMQATPLQMANVLSAVVNGGTLYKPQVVRLIRDPYGHVVKAVSPQVIRHVPVTAQALKAVRDGMADVTSAGGTGYGLAIDGLPYGGKTGTAQTAGGAGPNTTWFVAFAPVKHTKLAIAVFVDRSGGYGAQVAGPIARRILVEYFHKKP